MRSKRFVAFLMCSAAALGEASSVSANDVDVSWQAPRGCPDQERFRDGLSRRVGREVTFGSDANVRVSAAITAHDEGYELDLVTASPVGSERRKLQATSCAELARASLLIVAMLLSDVPHQDSAALVDEEDDAERAWSMSVRVRAIGDLGTLSTASFGPGVSVGVGWYATRLELGAMLLPSRDMREHAMAEAPGTLSLWATSAGLCQEFFAGPTFSPCAHFEIGRISGQGKALRNPRMASATWLVGMLGVRAGLELFDAVFASADVRAGMPWSRPRFAAQGAGLLHEVPALIGRLELGLEGRF